MNVVLGMMPNKARKILMLGHKNANLHLRFRCGRLRVKVMLSLLNVTTEA